MVALVQLHFIPVNESVDPDPWVTDRTGDKAISSRWMQRGRRGGLRESETMRRR